MVERRPGVVVDGTDADHVIQQKLADNHVPVARRHVQL